VKESNSEKNYCDDVAKLYNFLERVGVLFLVGEAGKLPTKNENGALGPG